MELKQADSPGAGGSIQQWVNMPETRQACQALPVASTDTLFAGPPCGSVSAPSLRAGLLRSTFVASAEGVKGGGASAGQKPS